MLHTTHTGKDRAMKHAMSWNAASRLIALSLGLVAAFGTTAAPLDAAEMIARAFGAPNRSQ